MTDEPTNAGRFSRREFIRRSAGTVVIAGGLPAILAACTGAGENTPSPAPSGATGAGATTGTLRVGWSSEPDTMNPLTSFSTEGNEVLQLIYDKLIDYDANLISRRAWRRRPPTSADGKTVTYTLRRRDVARRRAVHGRRRRVHVHARSTSRHPRSTRSG